MKPLAFMVQKIVSEQNKSLIHLTQEPEWIINPKGKGGERIFRDARVPEIVLELFKLDKDGYRQTDSESEEAWRKLLGKRVVISFKISEFMGSTSTES